MALLATRWDPSEILSRLSFDLDLMLEWGLLDPDGLRVGSGRPSDGEWL